MKKIIDILLGTFMSCAVVLFCSEMAFVVKAVETGTSTQEASEEKPLQSVDGIYWLILDGYSVSNNRAIAGDDIILTLRMANKNKKMDATNIVFTISGNEKAFLPQSGLSNQVFVEKIPAGEVANVDIPVSVSEGIEGNFYLDVRVDYSFSRNSQSLNGTSNQFRINVPVFLSSVITENVVSSSSDTKVKVKYLNTGSRDVYNVTAHFNGDISGTANYYIGNIAAENSGEIEVPVSFLSSGDKNIKVYYSYKNDKGLSIQSTEESFIVSVGDSVSTNSKDMDDEDEKFFNSTSVIILIVCFVVAVSSSCYGIISNKKKL